MHRSLYISILELSFCMQKGTIVEKLTEEVVKDGQHLRHLIGICEGNTQLLIYYSVFMSDKTTSF